jgi:hypothetical protein
MKSKLKPSGTERLKLKCDDPLSTFAFSFNLRRYSSARAALHLLSAVAAAAGAYTRPLFCST